MLAIQSKYQAVIFGNFAEISATSDTITTLLGMFRNEGLLPSTFQEIGANGISMVPRVKLSSSNGEWHISFQSTRIDIEKNPLSQDSANMGTIEAFTDICIDYFSRIISHYRIQFSRMSLVTGGMMDEMNPAETEAIHKKFFTGLTFYDEHLPFEWSFRNVSKIDNLTINNQNEEFNVITSINRVNGQVIDLSGIINFDRIEVFFDINTSANNVNPRFNMDGLREFFQHTLNLRTILLGQIEAKIRD